MKNMKAKVKMKTVVYFITKVAEIINKRKVVLQTNIFHYELHFVK